MEDYISLGFLCISSGKMSNFGKEEALAEPLSASYFSLLFAGHYDTRS